MFGGKVKIATGTGAVLIFLIRAQVFTRPPRFLSIQDVTSERERIPLILLPRGDGDALGSNLPVVYELLAGWGNGFFCGRVSFCRNAY
jgi:hypothetical protein